MSLYELAILGSATLIERETLKATLRSMISEFGLEIDIDVIIRDASTISERDHHAAFAAVYFGGSDHIDEAAAKDVVGSSAPIIPTVPANSNFNEQIPELIQFANGCMRRDDDPDLTELAAALL